MTRSIGSWRLAIGAALLATVGVTGCAENVGDVDRTHPDQIEKEIFETDDEWYFRQTVVDTDFQGSSGNAYMFEALESRLKRVRWVVTQDMLYAMSTVNPVDNLTDGLVEEEERRLGVVAAFPITSHFDIQRSYNSATGEQTNVITENASDRQWFERDYMRVDWSRNVADGVGLFSNQAGSFSAKAREIPQEEKRFDPHRTRISSEYIDATTEYFFEPDIYTCFNSFGFESIFNCEAGPVAIRNSFVRIDDEKTYEPLEYLDEVHLDDENGDELRVMRFGGPNQDFFQTRCDQELLEEDAILFGYEPIDSCSPAKFDMFGRFGYFRTERSSYDPARSSVYEEQRRYYANRWNIWQTAYTDEGETLIPLAERDPKPVVYHTNAGYPDHIWNSTQRVADEWNDVFVESVRLAKNLNTTEEAEAAIADANDGNPRMFSIVRNSCSPQGLAAWYEEAGNLNGDVKTLFKGKDENAIRGMSKQGLERMCSELEYVTRDEELAFDWQRVGDLRYSFFNWVDERVPWLGYGPSAADPLTGEIISGNANFAGETLERYGAVAADYIMFFDGRIPEEDLIWGDHVRDYFRNKVETGASVAEQELSLEERQNLRRISPVEIPEVGPGISIDEVPDFIRKAGPERVQAEATRVVESNILAKASDTRVLEFLEKPEVMNRRLQDPNFRFMVEARAASIGGPEYTDEDVHQAYVSASAPLLDLHRYERRNALFAERNMLSLETMEDGMAQVASYIGATDYFANSDRAAIERFFMDNIFYSTQLHEVGHTVGLRHNFGASADALNYHDEFWEMRAALAKGDLTEEEKWSLSKERAEQIFGHPIDEEYASEAEYREASIMDYGAGLVSGFPGLGKYDKAAIHFAYANKMEVFDESVDMSHFTDTLLWLGDYTHIPNFFSGGRSTEPAPNLDKELEGIDAVLNKRKWISIDEAKLERRNQIVANTQNYKNGELAAAGIKFDRAVPYEYCDDSFRGSRLSCNVFDFGANQREILQYEFDNYRVFQPYRRYNRGITNNLYQNVSTYQRWLAGILQAIQQPFYFYSIYQYFDLRSYTDDLREASVLAINFLGEVFAQPEPGDYCLYDESRSRVDEYWYYGLDDLFVPADWDSRRGSCANKIRINRGEGNFYNWDFTQDYNYRIRRVGTFVDKFLSLGLMFQISGNFAFSTFFTDARASNVSFWTLFEDEIYNYVRGIVLGDQSGFAGVYNPVSGSYEPPKIVDPKSFGTGLPPEQEGMDRVRTQVGFTEETDAIIYSILYNSTYLDQNTDMVQYMKVCVSNTECQEFPPGTVIKEFIHPETNQVYKAPLTADGRSISGDLIDHANRIKVKFEEARTDLDNSTPGTGAYATNLETFEIRSRQMEDVVGKLDRIRWVIGALGPNALY